MKEKTKVLGVRLPESKYAKLAELAKSVNLPVSTLASTLLSVGMEIGEELETNK